MRRIAALLVPLLFGFGQTRTPECSMAFGAHDGARHGMAATDAPHASSHAHPHDHMPSSPDSRAPVHGPATCTLVMSCGAAAAPSPAAVAALAPMDLFAAPGRLPYLYSSPVLNTDSPPPRGLSAA